MRGALRAALRSLAPALLACAAAGNAAGEPPDPAALYRQHCANCHGADRLGGQGPALLPQSLGRLKPAQAAAVIRGGRPATQMAGFVHLLSAEQVEALARWIYTPVIPAPEWGAGSIEASRIVYFAPGSLPARPQFDADPMNLFVVVEALDHQVTILDGDRLDPIARFPSRYALHGGPKFSPDGRYVFFASRDGWVSKFDLWNLKMVAEVRAGINTRNLAVSGDGKYVAVANYYPHTLVLLDAELRLIKRIEVKDREGRTSSRVSAVYDAAPRRSFVAALKDIGELWEISYDPQAEDIPQGIVHDFRLKEGSFLPGFLNPRRTLLDDTLDDFFFTPDYASLIGASRSSGRGQVVNLDVRRRIAELALPGMPHLGSGITWMYQGRRVLATPNLREGVVSVIDMRDWKILRNIPTPGAGFFIRSHEASRYAWVDSMMSPKNRDTLTVIDKQTLEVVAHLRPEPGKTLAHVEFTADGAYALASLWENDGALIVFDARSLREVKRIPARKPVGKYNVHNKITRSEGTSH
ncbi:MAG: dihydro-heme d1 dehydrogenase [Rhodocyclaceae bacterium]